MTNAQQKLPLSTRTLTLLQAAAPTTGLSPEEIGEGGAESYVRFLRATHVYLRASVPLMRAAIERANGSPRYRHLIPYLAQHIEDESGHDEWLLEDIAGAGYSCDTTREELIPELAQIVGTQYFHVLHGNLWQFFGYMYALETGSPSERLIEELKRSTGLPASAFRTLVEHQELDGSHSSELAELIDGFNLSAVEESEFIKNSLATGMLIHAGTRAALKLR